MRKKTNPIWEIPKEKLVEVIQESNSLSEALRCLDLYERWNIKVLKKRLEQDNISHSHIPLGQNSNIGRKFPSTAIPLKEVMIKDSTYNRGSLKRRLIKENILKNKCAICGQKGYWQNKKLVMVIDHINGINNDHRLENLRLLCPNCNSQTSTFSGKNNKKVYHCKRCGKEISKTSIHCKECFCYKRRIIKDRPSKKQLLKEIKETNYCTVGRKYGVSDKTIRKWLK